MIDVARLLQALRIVPDFERGGELWARCPFPWHRGERTASWSIRADRGPKHGHQICFGCGEGGSPVDLVAAKVGITPYGARSWIERRGLDVDDPVALEVVLDVMPNKYDLFFLPREVRWRGALDQWPTPARREMARRGITAREVGEWSIGYAADGKLAGRVVIPFFDETGDLKSYSARTIHKPTRQAPKYLTASKREGADHGAVFGAVHWPPLEDRREVFVTEGCLNGLAIRRVLPGAAIASLDGSEMLPGQALAIGTFERITIVSDPDAAGDKLAVKLAPFARWRRLRRVDLPSDVDANDLERSDPARLRALLRGVVKRSSVAKR